MNLKCSKLKLGDLIMFDSPSICWNRHLSGNYGIILSIDEEYIKWYNFKHKQCLYVYKNFFLALKKAEL